MADMRRRSPEPPPGPPQIEIKPGLAQETLRELAPLLAKEGIDVDNIDVPDLATLQAAFNRAVERHNMTCFTPVGHARDLAITTLRLVIEAIADDDTTLATAILEQAGPNHPATPLPPSPPASVSRSACSMTGSPAAPATHQAASAGASGCPPGAGWASEPRPTSLS
jgi:hypothetical protein